MARPRRMLAGLLGIGVMTATIALWPVTAAAAPANDDFDNPITIGSLPYTNTQDVSGATRAFDDPPACYNDMSVWYAFTPQADETVSINTYASNYPAIPAVYTGTRGSLNFVACNYSSAVTFTALANTTYYIMVGTYYVSYPGTLVISVIGPPVNDNFADATQIGSLPFTASDDLSLASTEPAEPIPTCVFGASPGGTVWYAYAAQTSQSITATITGGSSAAAVYTGGSLSTLTQRACQTYGFPMTFLATAGETYYVQAMGLYGYNGPITFSMAVTPPPQAGFAFNPTDPSIFDDIQFYDTTFDPAYVGIATSNWTFGDGGTATGCCPTHRYAADGSYTVTLDVTTIDGRTGSASGVLEVKTHDVGITKFSTPNNAKVGQTKAITVTVQSFRYPETVQVTLYSSVPGGYQFVGTLINVVPVGSNRAVNFNFSYTFTGTCLGTAASGSRCGDSTIGYVTFEAVATVVSGHDALPANNTAVSAATRIN